jgi:wyosine [tRNA(Phe)-imidazoG37] synthetase (radical SAM superfamily)
LEVFIIPGYNDNKEELAQIKQAIETIQPDRVQLNTLDRPGVVSSIRAATKTELTHILKHWNIANAEITPAAPTRKKMQSFRRDIESVMLGTITRRPCTVNDLVKILGLHVNEVNKYLGVLEADGRIKTVKQKRGYFYKVDKSEFTEQRH